MPFSTLRICGCMLLSLVLVVGGVAAQKQPDRSRVYLPLVAGSGAQQAPTPTATPGPPAPPTGEWTQDAHDAQRTGYTSERPAEPWKLLWTWNGPDANGGSGKHFYDAPREARTVTGGAHVYAPAGAQGLYALAKRTGEQAWNVRATSFNATLAYDPATKAVYAGGADGLLYKIDAATGKVLTTYNAGGPLNKSVLLTDGAAYVITDGGELHKVDAVTMQRAWVYAAGSSVATPPAYSATRGLIVFCTDDLNVHAVDKGSGARRWRVKPSPNPAGFPNEFEGQWPVIAERHGVVFVRMRLEHNALWSGPGASGTYPNSNAATRNHLQAKPQLKNLFALSLDDGSEKFVPAVGYGGVEDLVDGAPYLTTGPVPVIKTFADGKQVAYQIFRNGQSAPPDGRWDSHIGEMTLDDQTAPGLAAGDLRFVSWLKKYIITDEQTPLTMAGDTLFHAHWGASESATILDRSAARGLSYSDPITTKKHPSVIRRQQECGNFDPKTHWTTCTLTLFDDGRAWDGPGWWVYWNTLDPPTPSRDAYSEGILPRYTYVSDGLIIVQGNGGELFVLSYNEPK